MLSTPSQHSLHGYFNPAYPGQNEPDDDTWDNPGLPGQQAALEALQFSWDEAYSIGIDDGEWWYRRRDGLGGKQTASTPDDLRAHIATDYCIYPVPRQPPPSGTTRPEPPSTHQQDTPR